MISVENKINLFRQELDRKVENYRNEQIEKARVAKAQNLIDAIDHIDVQEKQFIERYKKQGERDLSKYKAETLAQVTEMKNQLRDDLKEDFTELILSKLTDELNGPTYASFLKRSIQTLSEIPDLDEFTLIIRNEDQKFFDSLKKDLLENKQITYMPLDQASIGGFKVRSKDGRVSYDFTLKNLLDENQKQVNLAFKKMLEVEPS